MSHYGVFHIVFISDGVVDRPNVDPDSWALMQSHKQLQSLHRYLLIRHPVAVSLIGFFHRSFPTPIFFCSLALDEFPVVVQRGLQQHVKSVIILLLLEYTTLLGYLIEPCNIYFKKGTCARYYCDLLYQHAVLYCSTAIKCL